MQNKKGNRVVNSIADISIHFKQKIHRKLKKLH